MFRREPGARGKCQVEIVSSVGWLEGCGEIIMGKQPLLVALFLAGLGGSVTHCLTMCSTFVIAQSPETRGTVARLLIPYHLGRITTYSALGAVAGLSMHMLSTWTGITVLRQLLLSFAAMAFLAIFSQRLLARVGFKSVVGFRLPGLSVCQFGKAAREGARLSSFGRYGLGLSLGLLPCPLVFAALTAAASASSPWLAAIGMALFGAGTAPALVAVAFTKANLLNKSPKLRDGLTLAALAINGMVLLTLAVR